MPISYTLLAGYSGGVYYPQSSYTNNTYGFVRLRSIQYLYADDVNLILADEGEPILI